MCVAAVIKGETPSLSDLQDMEIENPDGAGLAWHEPGSRLLNYKKGLTAQQVYEILPNLPRPALLHFRWTTHGSKAPYLTHPFPLGAEALTSRAMEGQAKALLIHNGIWTDYKNFLPDYAAKWDLSDTAVAAFVAKHHPEVLRVVQWATALGRYAGTHRPMSVQTTGDWKEYHGNAYSNLRWIGASYSSYKSGHWSEYYSDQWYSGVLAKYRGGLPTSKSEARKKADARREARELRNGTRSHGFVQSAHESAQVFLGAPNNPVKRYRYDSAGCLSQVDDKGNFLEGCDALGCAAGNDEVTDCGGAGVAMIEVEIETDAEAAAAEGRETSTYMEPEREVMEQTAAATHTHGTNLPAWDPINREWVDPASGVKWYGYDTEPEDMDELVEALEGGGYSG